MRNFFVLLVVANLALLGWGFSKSRAVAVEVAQPEVDKPDIPTLWLYGELPPVSPDPESDDGSALDLKGVAPQDEVPLASCTLLGPVDVAEALPLQALLADAGLNARLIEREVRTTTDYWVYLPASGSARNTTRVLDELKAGGIDSFVFSGGELEGAVGVSVFNDMTQAQRRQQELKALGYGAELHELPGFVQETWLVAGEKLPGLVEESEALSRLGREILQKPCETVASGPRIP